MNPKKTSLESTLENLASSRSYKDIQTNTQAFLEALVAEQDSLSEESMTAVLQNISEETRNKVASVLEEETNLTNKILSIGSAVLRKVLINFGRPIMDERKNLFYDDDFIMGPDIILPPDEGPSHEHNGLGYQAQETKFQEKFGSILHILQGINIHPKDIICFKGVVNAHSKRKVSYIAIEIPCLGKSILVCDQEGEATFVIQKILPRDMLFVLSKKKLQDALPQHVQRVIYNDNWSQTIQNLLEHGQEEPNTSQRSEPKPRLEKSTILLQEQTRQAILTQYPKASDWAKMNSGMRTSFKISINGQDCTLQSLGNIFQVDGNPVGLINVFAVLSQKIYGDQLLFTAMQDQRFLTVTGQTCLHTLFHILQENSSLFETCESVDDIVKIIQDYLRQKIRTQIPSYTVFAQKTMPELRAFEITIGSKTWGLNAIKNAFITHETFGQIQEYLTFAREHIYQELDSKNKVADAFLASNGSTAMKNIFQHMRKENSDIFQDCASDEALVQKIQSYLVQKVKEIIPTWQDWITKGHTEKSDLTISFNDHPVHLHAIASILGFEEPALASIKYEAALGELFYGKVFLLGILQNDTFSGILGGWRKTIVIDALKSKPNAFENCTNLEDVLLIIEDHVREKIKAKIHTPLKWMNQYGEKTSDFSIEMNGKEMKLQSIRSILKIEGNPAVLNVYAKLGAAIYGDHILFTVMNDDKFTSTKSVFKKVLMEIANTQAEPLDRATTVEDAVEIIKNHIKKAALKNFPTAFDWCKAFEARKNIIICGVGAHGLKLIFDLPVTIRNGNISLEEYSIIGEYFYGHNVFLDLLASSDFSLNLKGIQKAFLRFDPNAIENPEMSVEKLINLLSPNHGKHTKT